MSKAHRQELLKPNITGEFLLPNVGTTKTPDGLRLKWAVFGIRLENQTKDNPFATDGIIALVKSRPPC